MDQLPDFILLKIAKLAEYNNLPLINNNIYIKCKSKMPFIFGVDINQIKKISLTPDYVKYNSHYTDKFFKWAIVDNLKDIVTIILNNPSFTEKNKLNKKQKYIDHGFQLTVKYGQVDLLKYFQDLGGSLDNDFNSNFSQAIKIIGEGFHFYRYTTNSYPIEIAKILIDKYHCVNIPYYFYNDIVNHAWEFNQYHIIEFMLKKYPPIMDKIDEDLLKRINLVGLC